jgi:hypothetical protein
MQECKRLSIAVLPILREPSAAIEPSKRTLDNPAFGQDNEPLDPIRALDDLDFQMRANFGQRGGEFRSLIAAVGEQLLEKGKHPEQSRHDEDGSIPILNVGRMDNSVQ